MPFALTLEHRDFFKKNHYIEFEELLSLEQVTTLKHCAEETIAKRLRIPSAKLQDRTAPEIYQAGYDLWRDQPAIEKLTRKRSLAELASELFRIVPLRIGFDQYFAMTKCVGSPYDVPFSLQDISCLRPLAGGLILPLQDLKNPPAFFPMPLKAGSGLFISPTFALPWPQLFSTPELSFFLIAFAMDKTFYRADSRDPHAVSLKKLGYVFNDQLSDKIHPLIVWKNH